MTTPCRLGERELLQVLGFKGVDQAELLKAFALAHCGAESIIVATEEKHRLRLRLIAALIWRSCKTQTAFTISFSPDVQASLDQLCGHIFSSYRVKGDNRGI